MPSPEPTITTQPTPRLDTPPDYDPNQQTVFTAEGDAGEEFGGGRYSATITTCQEVVRQSVHALFTLQQAASTTTVDPTGIHEADHQNVATVAEPTLGGGTPTPPTTATPPDAVTPSIAASAPPDGGIAEPTGMEEHVAHYVRGVLEEVRTVLEDLDITFTINTTPEGKVLRIQSLGPSTAATPTSDETALPFEVMPDAAVRVSTPAGYQTGDTAVSLTTDIGGQPVRLISVTEAGRPTEGGGSSAATVNQAKIENKQTGLINQQVAVINVAIAIGNVINVQITD